MNMVRRDAAVPAVAYVCVCACVPMLARMCIYFVCCVHVCLCLFACVCLCVRACVGNRAAQVGVFCDAAFFPLLREFDFRQEGHRLEFSKANVRLRPPLT